MLKESAVIFSPLNLSCHLLNFVASHDVDFNVMEVIVKKRDTDTLGPDTDLEPTKVVYFPHVTVLSDSTS